MEVQHHGHGGDEGGREVGEEKEHGHVRHSSFKHKLRRKPDNVRPSRDRDTTPKRDSAVDFSVHRSYAVRFFVADFFFSVQLQQNPSRNLTELSSHLILPKRKSLNTA